MIFSKEFNHPNGQKLKQKMIEGYKKTPVEDQSINLEWDNAALEGWSSKLLP